MPSGDSLSGIDNLDSLWRHVDVINRKHFPKNSLMPIVGNGKCSRPKVMFVFINPTARNISSSPSWKGPRFPFIGTKQVWRIFHRAGLFDDLLMQSIESIKSGGEWSLGFTDEVLDFLKERDFYITNIVKWTGHDATLPDSEKISLFLPVLEREIEIVKPRYIVAFGLIPFERLSKTKIRLSDYYNESKKNKKLITYDLPSVSSGSKVIPCYFPVGRGNPKRAVELLGMLKNLE